MPDSSPDNASAVSPNPDPQEKSRRDAARRVIFLTVFLDLLGFGIIIPQLAVYASKFGAEPYVVGILASTYSAMGFLFTPFWGRLSDRIGRRPVLLYSIFGTGLGYILFAISGSLPLLFAARIVDGITGGNIATAQAYLSDITPPHERSKTFGLFGAVFGVGFAIGPMIGALLSGLPGAWGGNLGVGLFTAVLSFINWGMALRRLPETLPEHVRRENVARHQSSGEGFQLINLHGFRRAFQLPGLKLIIAISFFATVAFATLQGTYTLFLITRYARPQVQNMMRANPQAAIKQARREHSEAAKNKVKMAVGADESASPMETVGMNGKVAPYSRTMGGDINPKKLGLPRAPHDLTWRGVEKSLVSPRSAQLAAWIFASIGLTSLVVQGGLIGPLKKRIGEVPMVLVGTLLMALGLAIVPFPKSIAGEFPIMMLLAFGNSIAAPILTALVSELSPEAERGEIIGVFQSVQSLGRIVGPIVGGLLFNYFSPGAPYWAGAVIMFGSFLIARRLPSTHTSAPATA